MCAVDSRTGSLTELDAAMRKDERLFGVFRTRRWNLVLQILDMFTFILKTGDSAALSLL